MGEKVRIDVESLQVGMYFLGMEGGLEGVPFKNQEFLIKDNVVIRSLINIGLKYCFIDPQKGLPAPKKFKFVNQWTFNVYEESELLDLKLINSDWQKQTFDIEVKRALKICSEAKKITRSIFQQARNSERLQIELAESFIKEIYDSIERHPSAFLAVSRLRKLEDNTYMHSIGVCALMIIFSKHLGYDESFCKTAGLAGLLHDIGKAFMPIEILNKTDSLVLSERKIIEKHPEKGYEVLRDIVLLDHRVKDVCLHHHEKVNGDGYPHKLNKSNIEPMTKMASICDVYDAITSDRPYKDPWNPSLSLRKMAEWEGHFDEDYLKAFIDAIGVYPVGTVVRTSSGNIGVVIDQNIATPAQPIIRVFFSIDVNLRIEPYTVNCANENSEQVLRLRESELLKPHAIEEWNFDFRDVNAVLLNSDWVSLI